MSNTSLNRSPGRLPMYGVLRRVKASMDGRVRGGKEKVISLMGLSSSLVNMLDIKFLMVIKLKYTVIESDMFLVLN